MAVSAQPLEIRMARLEGAYEQIADRLNGLEHRIESLQQRVDSGFVETNKKIDSNLRTMITWMLGQTALIIGSMAALALHH
jgi:chromosome segregation ATPase